MLLGRRAGVSPAPPCFPQMSPSKEHSERLTLIPAEVSGVHHLQFKNRKAKFGRHKAG